MIFLAPEIAVLVGYRCRASSGRDPYRIDMKTRKFDAFPRLEDAQGRTVASDDMITVTLAE